MLNSDQKAAIEFIQQQAETLPVQARIKIYRGVAAFVPDDTASLTFIRRARILEEAEARCRSLNLKFETEAA
jgi:hypothetical protein